ncbi:MAG: hypothetical protein JW849_03960 [Phycisphaerae bacterium]|nr:hypothetical protein [Phycisphaerae bacterium]
MDLTSLYISSSAKRRKAIGRRIAVVHRPEKIGVVYVRRIPDAELLISPFARNIKQQRAHTTRTNARTAQCVRALACRTVSKRRLSTAAVPRRVRSA